MTQLALELPDYIFSALRLPPAEFAREMRIAAAVQWYAERRISQKKASEIAGLSRAQFIDELRQRKVPAMQLKENSNVLISDQTALALFGFQPRRVKPGAGSNRAP